MDEYTITEQKYFQLLGKLAGGMLSNSMMFGTLYINTYAVTSVLRDTSSALNSFILNTKGQITDKNGNIPKSGIVTKEQFLELLCQIIGGMLPNSAAYGAAYINTYAIESMLEETSHLLRQFIYDLGYKIE